MNIITILQSLLVIGTIVHTNAVGMISGMIRSAKPICGVCAYSWSPAFKDGEVTSCVKYYKDIKNWPESVEACKNEKLKAWLVDSKHWTIIKAMKSNAQPTSPQWVGLHDLNFADQFEWVDDKKKADIKNWHKGMETLDHSLLKRKDCAVILPDEAEYDTEPCLTHKYGRWCQYNPNVNCRPQNCSAGWEPVSRSKKNVKNWCIRRFDVSRTYNSARKACIAKKGTLLIIENRKMQANVIAVTKKLSLAPLSAWIGLNDLTIENQFVWENNAKLTANKNDKFFGNGEPNNFGNSEDCVEVRGNKLQWNDQNCSAKRSYWCQKKM